MVFSVHNPRAVQQFEEKVNELRNPETNPVRILKGQWHKDPSEKLIHLVDLIPKGNVKGGRVSAK